jgi:hypothetical protein
MSRVTAENWDAYCDERNAMAAARGCPVCNGSGHNCPECGDDSGEDDEDDSPYCRCDNLPTMGEVDRNRCSSCGKVLK